MLELCADLPVRSFGAGSILIPEGEPSPHMQVLVSGSVAVERDGVAFARIDSPGAVFGEMSWIMGRPATATVRAQSDVEVHFIEDPRAFFTENPEAALTVLRMTAARLDGLTRYLVDVKQQFAGMDGHLGMVDRILDTLVHHQGPEPRTGSARDPLGS